MGGTYGTREWAVRSVNCCDGCSHDCLYCYGKYMAARRGKNRIPVEKWREERIRQKDVDKGYKYREGRTMFPSSHDITPTNFNACFTVLKKLLESGNEVLVVLKPHLEIVQKLCTQLKEYKEKILFRFTITTADERILAFWEPNAPRYEERKASLKVAFDEGFGTSVSVEPMLDSVRVDELVQDLSPYVTDAIWIGKMNHLWRIRMGGDGVKTEIERIKAGQTDDKIWAIYNRHKDNPKIKWKESIKKVVGIPPVESAGMDSKPLRARVPVDFTIEK